MSLTNDYLFNHPEIKIVQDDEMFRINTDTQVLGEFIEVYRNDTVLDIGTNNGALLLYASLFNPKKLIGIEINEKAIDLAKKNLENNGVKNFEIINGDIITYSNDLVDVIICNPPYFQTRKEDRGQNKFKALAKHEGYLTLSALAKSIARNLKDNGTLYFLFLTSRLAEVFREFDLVNLKIKQLKFVYDDRKENSNVVLIKAVKNGNDGLNVLKPVIITR